MGKVGTTALQRSLKGLQSVRAYKTHFLSATSLKRGLVSFASGLHGTWLLCDEGDYMDSPRGNEKVARTDGVRAPSGEPSHRAAYW